MENSLKCFPFLPFINGDSVLFIYVTLLILSWENDLSHNTEKGESTAEV